MTSGLTVSGLLRRAAHNWPQKLGAGVAAFLLWMFVTSSSTTTTQRNLLVPLLVDGVEEGQLAVGLPGDVEVSVTGPSLRIDRLRPDMIRATLDLTGESGPFQQPITVQSPQGIRVLSVTPSDVIGFLETATSRSLPVEVGVTGAAPVDRAVSYQANPPRVTVTGRSQVLDTVQQVLAVAPAAGGTARVVALDAFGAPVDGVSFEPAVVAVVAQEREVLATKEVPMDLILPVAPGLVEVTASTTTVRVAGSEQLLAGLESVTGTVQPPTGDVAPGRYTLPVRLALPEGVVALVTPTAALQFEREGPLDQ